MGPTAFDGDGSLTCRAAGAITLGGGTTFGGYIAEAIKNDLKTYHLFDDSATVAITVELQNVDVSSQMGAAKWIIDSLYIIGNERVRINTIYHDRSSFAAVRACNNLALYFPKAVSQHLGELYDNPDFKAIVGETDVGSAEDGQARLRKLQQLFNENLITGQEYQDKKREILNTF